MKNIKKCLIIGTFLLSVILTQVFVYNVFADSDTVVFADSNLEAVIREAINKPAGEIQKSDVLGITDINARGKNIIDISGIENLTNLQTLVLTENKLRDLSPLTNLTKLTSLYLSDNDISDISALSKLTELTMLNLGGNRISDISILKNLSKLNSFSFDSYQSGGVFGNKIDVSVLGNLTLLEYIHINDCNIEDISSFSKLTNLKELYMYGTNVSDISSLKNLTSLRILTIRQSKVTDISPLSGLVGLQSLALDVPITNPDFLSNFTNLNILWLSKSGLSDISFLSNLSALDDLSLSGCQISDINIINKLTKLHNLDLCSVGISDISVLKDLTNLQSLNISGNKIKDISVIGNYKSLLTLDVSDNEIEDITALANCQKLFCLWLENNPILDYTPIKNIYSQLSTKDFNLSNITTITINGEENVVMPVSGAVTSQYTAVSKDKNGAAIDNMPVTWGVYDISHNTVNTLSIDNNGLLTINSTVVPNTYIIEARSGIETSVYSTKRITILSSAAALTPQLTGFVWTKGGKAGTTKATKVPAGTLRYIVGAEGSRVKPALGDDATAYTNILTANSDIAVSAGQHIFIAEIGSNGTVAAWTDVAVDVVNIGPLDNERIISGKIKLSDKAPAGGISVTICVSGNKLGYGYSVKFNEGEISKDYYITVTPDKSGFIYSVDCNIQDRDIIAYSDIQQVDVSNGNVSNVNISICPFIKPVYRNISGIVTFSKGVAPKGGLNLVFESYTEINDRISKYDDDSKLTIPEGKNSCNYSFKIATYPGYPCRVLFKDNTRYYWSELLDDASGDVTGVEANIQYALGTTESRNISGTIYLPKGMVAPKEGICLYWDSKSWFYTNGGTITIPEGKSSIAYDITIVTDTDERTELRFLTSNNDMQYSFVVGNVDTKKDITLEKAPAPQLKGFVWAQGSTNGTTKATVIPTGTLKYIVGAAGAKVQPNMGDSDAAYANMLTANADIPVTIGQHIFIVCVGNDGKIVGWADVAVDATNINSKPVDPPVVNPPVVNPPVVNPPVVNPPVVNPPIVNPPPPAMPPIAGFDPNAEKDKQQNKPVPKDGAITFVSIVANSIAKTEIGATDYKALLDSAVANKGIKNLIINIDNNNSSSFSTQLPASALTKSAKEVTATINTAIAKVEIPSNMFDETTVNGAKNISINIGKCDKSALPANIADKIGNAPVLDISATIDGVARAWSNPAAPVKISIPYTLKDGENSNDITVYYIDGNGKLENMQGTYNPDTKMVTFTTTHFSMYAVKENKISFGDLNGFEKYTKYIEGMASKGIIEGVGNNKYSPSKVLTRAEFATLLVKMLKLDITNVTNVFTDVKSSDWYAPYVNAAYNAGLISGIGAGKFAPNEVITNQDAAIILVKALKYKGAEITAESLAKVKDVYTINKYALDAVGFAVSKGIVTLDDNSNFKGKSNVNRAAAAEYIYKVFYFNN